MKRVYKAEAGAGDETRGPTKITVVRTVKKQAAKPTPRKAKR